MNVEKKSLATINIQKRRVVIEPPGGRRGGGGWKRGGGKEGDGEGKIKRMVILVPNKNIWVKNQNIMPGPF